MRKFYFAALFMLFAGYVSAQDDLLKQLEEEQKPKKEYVAYTFKATRVINGHSVETVKKKGLDFRVSHRFGDMAYTPNDHIHSFFGFDQAADIAILAEYGITDDLTVGIGRMKGAGPVRELWNANLKYRVLKQTKDFKIPFTITMYGNAVISSQKSSASKSDINYYEKKTYKGFANRMSYTLQALIACKATPALSIQLSPTFVWRNRVANDDKNGMFYLGVGGRVKVAKRIAIIGEYFLPIIKPGTGGREYFPMLRGKKDAGYYPNAHIGIEFETGGHVFTLNLTNTAGLLEQDYLPYNSKNWAQGQFRFGFTISRVFTLAKGANKSYKTREEGSK
jgi:hypothetical protein